MGVQIVAETFCAKLSRRQMGVQIVAETALWPKIVAETVLSCRGDMASGAGVAETLRTLAELSRR